MAYDHDYWVFSSKSLKTSVSESYSSFTISLTSFSPGDCLKLHVFSFLRSSESVWARKEVNSKNTESSFSLVAMLFRFNQCKSLSWSLLTVQIPAQSTENYSDHAGLCKENQISQPPDLTALIFLRSTPFTILRMHNM